MPRTRAARTWRSCPRPTTCRDREIFLDLCTAWLTQQPGSADGDEDPATAAPFGVPTTWSAAPDDGSSWSDARLPHVFSRDETRHHASAPCFLCGADGSRTYLLNPFSHRSSVQLCMRCDARSAGSE